MADPWAAGRGTEPYPTIKEACISDDVQLLARTFAAYGVTTTNPDKDALLRYACRNCLQHNTLATLCYILYDCGFSTKNISVNDMFPFPKQGLSTRILDVLLAYGWDINKRDLSGRSTTCEPLLWWVLEDEDLVKYCLEHGATVHPKGKGQCSPILERAAAEATVATFDLLRAHGAPLGWRPLHHAVHKATWPWLSGRPDALTSGTSLASEAEGKRYPKTQTYAERMAMVYHLVEDLGLDVNGPDGPPDQKPRHGPRGPPLCYVADSEAIFYRDGSEGKEILDTRELTWYLLDHGADPRPALEEVQWSKHPTFVADVEAWRAQEKHPAHERNQAREKNQAQETTQASKCCCQ
jgi:hypothetical protein